MANTENVPCKGKKRPLSPNPSKGTVPRIPTHFHPFKQMASKGKTLCANGKAGNWSQCSLSLPSLAHLYLRFSGRGEHRSLSARMAHSFLKNHQERERERKEGERGPFGLSLPLYLSLARSLARFLLLSLADVLKLCGTGGNILSLSLDKPRL